MSTQEKSGGQSESPKGKGGEEVFICPLCDVEHAVPGQEGAEQLCPKCKVPLKPKKAK